MNSTTHFRRHYYLYGNTEKTNVTFVSSATAPFRLAYQDGREGGGRERRARKTEREQGRKQGRNEGRTDGKKEGKKE